jgi:hypothetical protein
MLQPIPAISNVSAASQKQAIVVSAGVAGPNVALNATAAPSHGASASVEGKLNLLLMAIRDRMVQSLLDIMNEVGESLGSPPDAEAAADTGNVARALRLADVIQGLTPKQLATVQQQLQAQGQTLPLQLIAQALKNPAGPEAAHVIAYLETARFKGRDLVAEAVIDSYGENEGLPTTQATPVPDARSASSAVAQSTPAKPQAAQSGAAERTNSNPSTTLTEEGLVAGGLEAGAQLLQAEVVEVAVSDPLIASMISTDDEAVPVAADEPGDAEAFVAASVAEALEVVGDNQPSEVAATDPQIMQGALPTELKEIAADIQEGLKVAIQFAMDAVGPEIDSIIAQGEQIANAVIADALIADVLDAAELHQQDAARNAGDLPLPSANAPAPVWQEAAEDTIPLSLGFARPPSDASTLMQAAFTEVAVPTPPPVQLPLGVPFAIVQYPPAQDVINRKDALKIDRVDAVGDEAEGKGGQQEKAEEDEEGDQAREQPEEATEQMADASDEPPVPANGITATDAEPVPLALPMPGPAIGLQQEAYDFYQRMAAE